MFQPGEDGGSNAFTGFKNYVPYKTIADYDFDRSFEKIPSFNIADEVNRS